jgi:hypothetical protein
MYSAIRPPIWRFGRLVFCSRLRPHKGGARDWLIFWKSAVWTSVHADADSEAHTKVACMQGVERDRLRRLLAID